GAGCIEAVIMWDKVEGAAAGERFLFDGSGSVVAQLSEKPVPDEVISNLPSLAKRPGPSVRNGISYLPVLPRITLLIVGGGHVGAAVARLAADVDFDIWIL